MIPKKKKLVSLLIVAGAAAVLTALGFWLLPDVLTVQASLNGHAGNTAPKAVALLFPCALTVLFAVLYYVLKDGRKCFGVSLVGLLILLMDFLFNL